MPKKKLVLAVVLVAALVAGFLVSSGGAFAAKAMVPDCNCTIHNYPEPGDTLHGVRVNGECFADPCATSVE